MDQDVNTKWTISSRACIFYALFMTTLAFAAHAQDAGSVNTFGMPGMVDMPIASSFEDAQVTTSISAIEGQIGATLSFQIAPRLTGAFRYSIFDDFRGAGRDNFDRSFDLQYKLVDEGRVRPAVAIGLRDFIGTGLFSGEYVVASKHFGDSVLLTGGLGWGAIGSRESFENPLSVFGDRFIERSRRSGLGGEPNFAQWFRGPASGFAGVSWRATDRLTLNFEYSSDNESRQLAGGVDGLDSPFNFGLQYRLGPGTVLGAQFLHGEIAGVTAHFILNPRKPPSGGDRSPAPIPILSRDNPSASWAGAITQDAIPSSSRTEVVRSMLKAEGIELQAIAYSQASVRVQINNLRYDIETQAIGRAARVLSFTMPKHIETFEIEIMARGLPISRVTLQRTALERLENTPEALSAGLSGSTITTGLNDIPMQRIQDSRLNWSLGPYFGVSLFDPDNPLRADVGIELEGSYDISPTLSFSGAVRGKLIGNRDQVVRQSDSVLPRVRSNRSLYDQASDVWLHRLTLDHFGKITDDLYTRASFGYFEEMFAGLSGEILWKPVDSRLALGFEINQVFQRDNDRLFGFDDYDYDVTSGHISVYYAMPNGFDLQLDAGRYLAGDWGATIGVDRRFGNGWSIGAFATLTDVSFEDFGEGSFDKGIRFSVPLSWLSGSPNQTSADVLLRPIQRDGGARLSVSNRLYPLVRDLHAPELNDQWGRFWR